MAEKAFFKRIIDGIIIGTVIGTTGTIVSIFLTHLWTTTDKYASAVVDMDRAMYEFSKAVEGLDARLGFLENTPEPTPELTLLEPETEDEILAELSRLENKLWELEERENTMRTLSAPPPDLYYEEEPRMLPESIGPSSSGAPQARPILELDPPLPAPDIIEEYQEMPPQQQMSPRVNQTPLPSYQKRF